MSAPPLVHAAIDALWDMMEESHETMGGAALKLADGQVTGLLTLDLNPNPEFVEELQRGAGIVSHQVVTQDATGAHLSPIHPDKSKLN